MARPKSPINRLFLLKQVVSACAVDPEVVPDLKNLVKTGKRGRPRIAVNGKEVMKVLAKHKDTCATRFFLELV